MSRIPVTKCTCDKVVYAGKHNFVVLSYFCALRNLKFGSDRKQLPCEFCPSGVHVIIKTYVNGCTNSGAIRKLCF